ncbi:MAG: L-carnitine dehydratase/bile acid-inducible protein, partial [Actinomycetia bacterium]|nr:L-carnitine dehydratase/bile acid-inducible protein [Actinomycetes bacterium]
MGPLAGIKIVELAGIGPGPFAGMLLSDMGADIVRVDRAQQVNPAQFDKPNLEPLYRGRRSIGVDLKNPEGVELVLRLVEGADALFE